jgi:hypothetical protein
MQKGFKLFAGDGSNSHKAIAQAAAVLRLVRDRTIDVFRGDQFAADQQIT